jgi:hypothetical protein
LPFASTRRADPADAAYTPRAVQHAVNVRRVPRLKKPTVHRQRDQGPRPRPRGPLRFSLQPHWEIRTGRWPEKRVVARASPRIFDGQGKRTSPPTQCPPEAEPAGLLSVAIPLVTRKHRGRARTVTPGRCGWFGYRDVASSCRRRSGAPCRWTGLWSRHPCVSPHRLGEAGRPVTR